MATDDPSSSDAEQQQTTIDGFIDRPSGATSRTDIHDDKPLGEVRIEAGGEVGDVASSSSREVSVPGSPDKIPDPDSPAVQAAAVAGRTALSPLLSAMGDHDEMKVPSGRYHDIAADIADSLRTIARRGHSMRTVFDDWLNLLLYALAAGDHEAAYQETAQQYAFNGCERGDRGIDYLGQATGQLFEGVVRTGADVLGDVYHILGKENDKLGQFFTPHNVARAKIEMVGVVEEPTSEYERGDRHQEALDARHSVMDPACGSGRLLVSGARAQPDAWYAGVDLDSTCAKMAALNLVFCNVDGQVIHGNSLTMETYTVYDTYYTEAGGVVSIGDPEEKATVLDT